MTAGGAGADVWLGLGRSHTDIGEGGVGVAELGERFAGGSAGCDGGQALLGAAAVLPDVQIRPRRDDAPLRVIQVAASELPSLAKFYYDVSVCKRTRSHEA
jgi:hypothetical protein